MYRFLCEHVFGLLGSYTEELSYGNGVYRELPHCFPQWPHHFTFCTVFHSGYTTLPSRQQSMRVPVSPHPQQHLVFSVYFIVFIVAVPVGMKCYLIVVLTCIALLVSDVEHLFMYLVVICIPSLETCLFTSFARN